MKQREMPVHLHAHFTDAYIVYVEVFKFLCHDNDRVVIGYQVFIYDFVFPANLVTMSFESLYAARFLTPISSASCIPIKRTLYSETLLEHGSVNENA